MKAKKPTIAPCPCGEERAHTHRAYNHRNEEFILTFEDVNEALTRHPVSDTPGGRALARESLHGCSYFVPEGRDHTVCVFR